MYPVSHNENAHISQLQPFFEEKNSLSCFPTMAYEYDENILVQQYQSLLVYQQESSRAYENAVADTVQEAASCREQAARDVDKKVSCIPEKPIPKMKKKPAKKDRHSKINTAQGPRDRRMRISLEVAKQFFALQDMLGFDKGSKTVEWLLTQSKDEILSLARGISNSNQSYCNFTPKSASSIIERGNDGYNRKDGSFVTKEKARLDKVKKRVKKQRKTAFRQVGKESREKARERARERTKEKIIRSTIKLNEVSSCNEVVSQEKHQGCSRTRFTAQSTRTFKEVVAEVEEPSSNKQVEDITDDGPMVILENWSPSLVFNYLQNNELLEELAGSDKSS